MELSFSFSQFFSFGKDFSMDKREAMRTAKRITQWRHSYISTSEITGEIASELLAAYEAGKVAGRYEALSESVSANYDLLGQVVNDAVGEPQGPVQRASGPVQSDHRHYRPYFRNRDTEEVTEAINDYHNKETND
jgi:hypothetical protein